MVYALFKTKSRPDMPDRSTEQRLADVRFTVHKFNARPKPADRKRIVIASCFSEFGCEVIGCLYCLPRVTRRYPGRYVIAMGWHGRAYLYQHLVDEYWELEEGAMWLKDHCYAFHYSSRNLKSIEEKASEFGTVLPSVMVGSLAVMNFCRTCGHHWNQWKKHEQECPRCKSTFIVPSIFGGPQEYRKQVRLVPKPGTRATKLASELVPENAVGVFARNRITYGRNLPPDFYERLIRQLQSRGHTVVWMGEKQSTLACPVSDVYDHSRSPLARDMELTLAMIGRMRFTLQFWTASSRLAGIMGTPYILFESPEQIYSTGNWAAQEGRRLELTTFGPRKVVASVYLNSLEDQPRLLSLVDQAIDELHMGNEQDLIGLVDNPDEVLDMQSHFYSIIRGS